MKYITFVVLYFISTQVVGQGYINKSKDKSKKIWNKGFKNYDFIETDTSLQLITNDTSYSPIVITLKYSLKGKCQQELYQLECDSCYQKLLNNILKNKLYGWRNLKKNFYITNFISGLTLETSRLSSSYFITIVKPKFWTKREYNQLIKN